MFLRQWNFYVNDLINEIFDWLVGGLRTKDKMSIIKFNSIITLEQIQVASVPVIINKRDIPTHNRGVSRVILFHSPMYFALTWRTRLFLYMKRLAYARCQCGLNDVSYECDAFL